MVATPPTPLVTFTVPRLTHVRYGGTLEVGGTVAGQDGTVVVWGKERGAARSFRVASVEPVAGEWRLRVSPRATTRYEAIYAGTRTSRVVYVDAILRTVLHGRRLTVTVRPVPAYANGQVWLYHLRHNAWTDIRILRASRLGVVSIRLAPGRYFLSVPGGGRFAGATGPQFAVG